MLQDKVIGIYCGLIDDILKSLGHYEPLRRQISDREVITTALVSALYCKGNLSHTVNYMRSHKMMPGMINKSGFTKRLHQLQSLMLWLFMEMGRLFKYICAELEYIIDSFPVKVCHNMRISRSRLLQGEKGRGYNASKREYFYAVKVQLVTTTQGIPVEVCFVPGSDHDVEALKKMYLDLPARSILYADSAYTAYEPEALYKETENIELKISRKSNRASKRTNLMKHL